MALCRWSTSVQELEEVSRMVMLIMLMLMLMLLLPRLQTKTALCRVSRVAQKKVRDLAKKYDAFLASDTLIKLQVSSYLAQASRRWVQIYI